MSLHDRILLATDLGARSDRALDRAVRLASREGAELVVLHVIDPTSRNLFYPRTQTIPELAALVRSELAADLGACTDRAGVRIEEGEPAETIVRVARELAATLVVVGVARFERLGRFSLGTTVERLIRGLETPLLIVMNRAHKLYQRVAVAVDFSSVSKQTLGLAMSLFPDQRITAFHAYQPLATYGASNLDLHRAQFLEMAGADFAKWLASTNLSPPARARIDARLELGEPDHLIREAARRGEFDLVVVGTRGRGRIFEFFIGSVAKRILDELPCDALFVREAK